MVIVKHIYTYTQKNPAAKADVLNCETHVNSGTHVSQTCRCAVLLNTSSTTACSSGGAAASINTLPGEAWREAECSFNRGRLALITPIFLPQFTEQFAWPLPANSPISRSCSPSRRQQKLSQLIEVTELCSYQNLDSSAEWIYTKKHRAVDNERLKITGL